MEVSSSSSPPARPQAASRWFNRHQADVLSERYLDIMLGSPGSSLLFIVQAPVIGLALALAWEKIGQATSSLHFLLILSAIWFGCINACQEIVKEKALYRRERMFDLNIGSYVYSKVKVLAIFGVIQCASLLGIVNHFIHIKGNLILMFLILLLAYLAAMLMGLILSALVNSADKALMLAPVLTIPQIIFSEQIVPRDYLTGAAGTLQQFMVSKWGYQALEKAATATAYFDLAKDLAALAGFSLVYFILTVAILKVGDKRA